VPRDPAKNQEKAALADRFASPAFLSPALPSRARDAVATGAWNVSLLPLLQ